MGKLRPPSMATLWPTLPKLPWGFLDRPNATGIRSSWSAPEPDLVSVGIPVCDLADTVRIGFPLRGVESPASDLRYEPIDIIDEERVPGVPGVFRLLHNVHVPMFCKRPNCLCVVRKECGRKSQQLFVPFDRCRVVGYRNSREQIKTVGLNHAYYTFPTLKKWFQTRISFCVHSAAARDWFP